jgi:hypothetical protein
VIAIPAPERTNWIKIDTEPQLLTCEGFGYWYSHWDPERFCSVRCAGQGCSACERGAVRDIRYVLLVSKSPGVERFWLELRRPHHPTLAQWNDEFSTVVGCRFFAKKSYAAKNAPVVLELVSWSKVAEISILRFCESLGQRVASSKSHSGKQPGDSMFGT